jgi:GTP cyclohydrolase IA
MAGGLIRIRPLDRVRAEHGVRELLTGLGFDLEGPLGDTPARVVEAYANELLSGYSESYSEVIARGSEPCPSQMDPVLLRDVAIATVCPHHLLVAEGRAMVAYEPGERLLGLGALVSIVHIASRRLAFQEEIASAVVEALMSEAGAKGAFCRVTLNHACLRDRGSREFDAEVVSGKAVGTLGDARRLALCLGVEAPNF